MVLRFPREKELTFTELDEFIGKHRQEVSMRYEKLKNAYEGKHDILFLDKKASHKPDNRIVVNFPKYIVDTFNGFFIGNPVKTVADEDNISSFVEFLDQYNDQDDNNAELSKICSIYGHGFEMYYLDEEQKLCITYLNPMEAFMIYDESIVQKPLYFVRRYTDYEGNEYGSISDSTTVRHFQITGGLQWIGEPQLHYFGDVPATEYLENEERLGAFEPVLSMINAFNKAISEKANDVDYFADAYLKVLGAELDPEDTKHIRENRIINFYGEGGENVSVDFMGKPESDTTQENLLNRLEMYIFLIGMVANVSDENFGVQSGIALQYKVLAMRNLAKTKERKFTSGMNRRYKLLFGHPLSAVQKDDWVKLKYQFTLNIPSNMLEETDIATKLEGVVSKETQLKVLSLIDNVKDEIAKMEEEAQKAQEQTMQQAMTFGAVAAAGAEQEQEEQLENPEQLEEEETE